MLRHSLLNRLAAAAGLIALVLLAYVFVARPYMLHWGATEQELSRAMPGDDLDPTP